MKKVVRLTESDIVRLVKKVINENKRMLTEDEKIGYVSVGVVNPSTQGLLKIDGVTWKAKLPSQNGNNEYLVVKQITRNGGEVCISNPSWGLITEYCLSKEEQDEFANHWYDAKANNRPKFTVKDGKVEFIRA